MAASAAGVAGPAGGSRGGSGGSGMGAAQYISLGIYKQSETELGEFGDFLDSRSARQLAEVRLARNQAWAGQVLDSPWRVGELLQVEVEAEVERKRKGQDKKLKNGVSLPIGEEDEKKEGDEEEEEEEEERGSGIEEVLKKRKEALREQVERLVEGNKEAEKLHRDRLDKIRRAAAAVATTTTAELGPVV
jgi:hypothetical protein